MIIHILYLDRLLNIFLCNLLPIIILNYEDSIATICHSFRKNQSIFHYKSHWHALYY